jgi:hypothetical protein
MCLNPSRAAAHPVACVGRVVGWRVGFVTAACTMNNWAMRIVPYVMNVAQKYAVIVVVVVGSPIGPLTERIPAWRRPVTTTISLAVVPFGGPNWHHKVRGFFN